MHPGGVRVSCSGLVENGKEGHKANQSHQGGGKNPVLRSTPRMPLRGSCWNGVLLQTGFLPVEMTASEKSVAETDNGKTNDTEKLT